jgi:hypothetical protein
MNYTIWFVMKETSLRIKGLSIRPCYVQFVGNLEALLELVQSVGKIDG